MKLNYSKIYLCAVLIVAVIISPLSYSILAIALLVCQLYLFWKREHLVIAFLIELLCVVSMPFTLNAVLPAYFSALLVLPSLPLISQALKEIAGDQPFDSFSENTGFSTVPNLIMISLGLLLLLSLITAAYALSLTVAGLVIYLAVMVLYAYRALAHPLSWQQGVELKLVVGESKSLLVEVQNRTGKPLFIRVAGAMPWVKVSNQEFSLADKHVIEASVEPPLSGPSFILLNVSVRDTMGLLQFGFVVSCAKLTVIPRVKYSKWLAGKYLEKGVGSGVRGSALAYAVTSVSGQKGSGIEYHSSHVYSPGDSIRRIDWKHTSHLRELVVKHYQDVYGSAAVVMVNLTAGSDDEADKISSNLVNSVLTLALASVNAALIAYNKREVVELTSVMPSGALLKRVLQLIERVNMVQPAIRYLWPPDARKLERTRRQLAKVDLEPAKKLLSILDIESEAIKEYTSQHPVSLALTKVTHSLPPPAMIIPITAFNHDAEALSLLLPKLEGRGYKVLPLSIDNTTASRIGITPA